MRSPARRMIRSSWRLSAPSPRARRYSRSAKAIRSSGRSWFRPNHHPNPHLPLPSRPHATLRSASGLGGPPRSSHVAPGECAGRSGPARGAARQPPEPRYRHQRPRASHQPPDNGASHRPQETSRLRYFPGGALPDPDHDGQCGGRGNDGESQVQLSDERPDLVPACPDLGTGPDERQYHRAEATASGVSTAHGGRFNRPMKGATMARNPGRRRLKKIPPARNGGTPLDTQQGIGRDQPTPEATCEEVTAEPSGQEIDAQGSDHVGQPSCKPEPGG